jgi:hypothetical protein
MLKFVAIILQIRKTITHTCSLKKHGKMRQIMVAPEKKGC